MRDADLTRRACEDATELTRLAVHVHRARADYHLWASLHPSGSNGGGRGPGPSDPTASKALNERETRFHRQMAAEYAGIGDDLEEIHLAVRRLARRIAVATANRVTQAPTPGCRTCEKAGHWTPISNVHGQQCRWCHDFRVDHGADPAAALVQAHHEGRKITARMIREHTRPAEVIPKDD